MSSGSGKRFSSERTRAFLERLKSRYQSAYTQALDAAGQKIGGWNEALAERAIPLSRRKKSQRNETDSKSKVSESGAGSHKSDDKKES